MKKNNPTPTHQAVQEHYGRYAQNAGSCCGGSSCCDGKGTQNALYSAEVVAGIPDDIVNFSAGSGDPISLAKLHPGESVLDLGSGGGLDCFMAARQVGENGRVIGVDMTVEMLDRSRSKLAQLDLRNVEFREGLLEDLPVDGKSIDVIISNCVINLSPDKPQVFKEMFRVLKPGGRIAISDPVSNQPMPKYTGPTGADWCGCTSGALSKQEYAAELEKAGFGDIQIVVDSESVIKMVENGEVSLPEELTREQLLKKLAQFESDEKLLVVPHQITARKPNA